MNPERSDELSNHMEWFAVGKVDSYEEIIDEDTLSTRDPSEPSIKPIIPRLVVLDENDEDQPRP